MREGSDRTTTDAQLTQLLATLRVTETPEADFEERFLYDFHERVACAAVVRPARYQLWEHLMQALANFGRRRIAFGASTLGVGALAMGFFAIPGEENHPTVAGAALSRFDSSITTLTPGLTRDYDNCTSIRVVKAKSPFAHEANLVANSGSGTMRGNAYTSSATTEQNPWSVSAAEPDDFASASLFAY